MCYNMVNSVLPGGVKPVVRRTLFSISERCIMKYSKGDLVVYGTNGICKIDDIQKMTFPMETAEHTYYVLRPIASRTSTLFVPDHKEELISKMRYVLKKEEIDAILVGTVGNETKWIDDKNERNNEYRSIVANGDPESLLGLIRCLYERKAALQEKGKKLPSYLLLQRNWSERSLHILWIYLRILWRIILQLRSVKTNDVNIKTRYVLIRIGFFVYAYVDVLKNSDLCDILYVIYQKRMDVNETQKVIGNSTLITNIAFSFPNIIKLSRKYTVHKRRDLASLK